MSQLVQLKPHEWSGKSLTGSVLLEWSDEDAFVLEVGVSDTKPRKSEGAHLSIDYACASFDFEGAVHVKTSVVMTEAEARELHAAIGRVLAE